MESNYNKTTIDLFTGQIKVNSLVIDGDTVTLELEKTTDKGDVIYDYVDTDKIDLGAYIYKNLEPHDQVSAALRGFDIDRVDYILENDLYLDLEVINYLRTVWGVADVTVGQFLAMPRTERDEYLDAVSHHKARYGSSELKVWAYNAVAYIDSRRLDLTRVELNSLRDLPNKRQIAVKQALDLYLTKFETCSAA